MRIEIPEYLGQATPFECPGSDRTVAVIPRMVFADRCVYEFERATADVLDYLAKNYGLRTVFIDGADGELDVSWLTDRHSDDKWKEIVKQTFEEYMKKGDITGLEYLMATSDYDITGIGIEDRDLYKKSKGVLENINTNVAPFHNVINSIRAAFRRQLRSMAPDVAEFDAVVEQYERNEIGFDKFFYYLEERAKELRINIEKEFPHFYRTVETFRNPWAHTYHMQAKALREALIEATGRELEKESVVPLSPKQAVEQLAHYEEEYQLRRTIRMVLCRNKGFWDVGKGNRMSIVEADEHLETARRIISYEASPELIGELKDFRSRFSSLYFKDLLLGYDLEVPAGISIIDVLLPQMERFYEMAFQRQQHYADRIEHHVRNKGENFAAALITGFNVRNAIGLLGEKGISTWRITPEMKSVSRQNAPQAGVKKSASQDMPGSDVLTEEQRKAFEELFPVYAKDFTTREECSHGAYKRVIKLRKPETGELLALKIADFRDPLNDRARAYLEKRMKQGGYKSYAEVLKAEADRAKELSELENDHISRLLGAGLWRDVLFLFLEEYSERTLKDYVRKNHPLSSIDVNNIAEQLAEGLSVMHSARKYHGDLKPENILFRNGIITITDFGLASSLPDENGLSLFNETAAPEIIGGGMHTAQSDVWTYGVDVFFTRTGEFPFPTHCSEGEWQQMPYEKRKECVREQVLDAIRDKRRYSTVMGRIDDEFDRENFSRMAKVIKKCLSIKPKKRFKTGEDLYRAVNDLWIL